MRVRARLVATFFAVGCSRPQIRRGVVSVLVEFGLVEQRYKAVLEVLDGATVIEVARRYGVSRQSVHACLRRYASHGLAALADKGSRPMSCPRQMSPAVEVRVVELCRAHPERGPRTIPVYLVDHRGNNTDVI